MTSFAKFEIDMRNLLRGAGQDWLVTTMLDYYRLPADFPGMATRPHPVDLFTRVRHVEQAITAHFNDGRLLPFLALHEFEPSSSPWWKLRLIDSITRRAGSAWGGIGSSD